ncbi:MAG TPA: hypothetical protein VFA33_08520 [Bryobacteraceae bacterium]|nr:hypothetical protein [Bryobacteraceae bacterium]
MMPTVQSKPGIVRALPSLTDAAFLMPIVFLFLKMDGARTMLGDGDTGWHVRTGEWILDHARVPSADMFSFSKPGAPWFAWEWLWDAMFGWLYRQGGMAAVVIASIVVLCFTFALLFRLVRGRCNNAVIAFGVTVLALAASSIHWLARPHLFTLLFAVIFLGILERVAAGERRLLWLLPLLTVVWTNLHGGFFVALLLMVPYAAGEFTGIMAAPGKRQYGQAWKKAQPYVLAALGCLLASLLNPYTYHLHQHVFEFLTDPFPMLHIDEYKPLSFQAPAARFFEPMIVLGLAAALWHLLRRRFTAVFLLAGWAHLGLIAARNVPLFAIVAAPWIAQAIEEGLAALESADVAAWLRRAARAAREFGGEFSAMDRIGRWHLASAAGLALTAAMFYAPAPRPGFQADYDPSRYPAGALRVLESAESHHIFTHDEWGDYLIYKLFPKQKVFVDGRMDFYGSQFMEAYLDVLGAKYDWQRTLERYRIDTIVLPPDAPLTSTLKESHRWRVVYDDHISVVFRAMPAAEHTASTPDHGEETLRGRPATAQRQGPTASNNETRS